MPLPIIGIELNRQSDLPLYQQLYESLRRAILEQRLRPGQRLPATRKFAEELGISRSTVLLAYEHLVTEGYAEGKTGAGTFISETIPEHLLHVGPQTNSGEAPSPKSVQLSERGQAILDLFSGHSSYSGSNLRPFRPGVPGLRDFPFELWSRLVQQQSRDLTFEDYGYSDPAGYRPLREAVANYLRQVRAVRCEADQVIIIVNGTQQALDLACRLLLNPGEAAWVEDPGYNGAKEALIAAGARIIPVPVDEQGLDVEAGEHYGPDARLAYITPSHQYPMGVTMSLPRRLELLNWAERRRAWILEDDYDSEYRYGGRPLSSLQGIDQNGRVLYMGTFSKILFPGMRLGYLIVPPPLIRAFVALKDVTDRQSAILEQAVTARFITEGHFERHLRRMRLLYAERQRVLLATAEEELSSLLTLRPADTGLHLVGRLPDGWDDREAAAALQKEGIVAGALSGYTVKHTQPPGLILGYAPYRGKEIKRAVRKMREVMERRRKAGKTEI